MAAIKASQPDSWIFLNSFLIFSIAAKAFSLAGRNLEVSLALLPALTWQDIAVALAFGAVLQPLSKPFVRWVMYAILASYLALNVPVIRLLSTPLTWRMLHATGTTLSDSIEHHATSINLVSIFCLLGLAAVLPWMISHAQSSRKRTILLGCTVWIFIGVVSEKFTRTDGLERSPLALLVSSAFPRISAQADDDTWRSPLFQHQDDNTDLSWLHGKARQRNIVLILLESTGARYLKLYGANNDPTPHLTALASTGIIIDNAYCAYPESIKGLFSILCSKYPAMDTEPEIYARVKSPALAQILKNAGYATALFHSGRFAYLGMKSVIADRGYQLLEDAGQIGGNIKSSFGVDEPATIQRMLQWLDTRSSSDPFFITYLPIAGHHPYETPESGPLCEKDDASRYLNALHYGDESLGKFIAGLKARGLYENTLFCIAGDHGEAFGQHEGNFGHTLFIYEENIRVPFLLAAPGLIQSPIHAARISSLIDMGPTILDLIGINPPHSFQGQSLLRNQDQMALFYTDYSLGLLGLREVSWKYIYEVESGHSQLFNLQDDPWETLNLARQFPSQTRSYQKHLQRWGSAQRATVTIKVAR